MAIQSDYQATKLPLMDHSSTFNTLWKRATEKLVQLLTTSVSVSLDYFRNILVMSSQYLQGNLIQSQPQVYHQS